MKIVKITGLAAVMALAITAWGGSSTALASETTLCKTSTHSPYCASEDRFFTNIALGLEGWVIFTPQLGGEVNCEVSIEAETTASAGDPLPISKPKWQVSSCFTSCQPQISSNGSGSITWTDGTKGSLALNSTMTFNGSAACPTGPPDCKRAIPNIPDINFTGETVIVPPTVMTTEDPRPECSNKIEMEAELWSTNPPEPAYVAKPVMSEEHTRLCKVDESPCSSSNTYPVGTTIEAEAPELEIKGSAFDIFCGKTTMTAKTQALGASPLPLGDVEFTMQNCNSFAGSCIVTTSKPSTGAGIEASGAGIAEVDLYVTWNLQCGQQYNCTLGFEGAPGRLTNGNPATVAWTEVSLNEEIGSHFCQEIHELNVVFTVTSPKPLFAV